MSTERDRSVHRSSGPASWPLTLAAVVGAVSIIVFVLALLFGLRVYAFASGSMAPTVPQGSLAISQRIDATAVSVGDVVTIDRQGQPPVTHRVVSIEPGEAGSVRLELRGDANDANDASPYDVDTVHRMLWSVPLLGTVLGTAATQPWLILTVTVVIAAGVTWYWWPGSGRRRA